MKEKLGFGCLGNGTTVWDSSRERNNDYPTVAHISDDGSLISIYETLSLNAREKIEENAIDTFKKRYATNNTIAVMVKHEWMRKVHIEIKAWNPSLINKKYVESGDKMYVYVGLLHPLTLVVDGKLIKLYDCNTDAGDKFAVEVDKDINLYFKDFKSALNYFINFKNSDSVK